MRIVMLTTENVKEFALMSGDSVEKTQEKLNATLAQNEVAFLVTDEFLLCIPSEIIARIAKTKEAILITNKKLFEEEAERPLFNG